MNQTVHIMIDIETVGRRNDAGIREVGLVAFDYSGKIVASKQLSVAAEAWSSLNRTFTGETIIWIKETGEIDKNPNCMDYESLLNAIDAFFKENNSSETRVWAKGHMDLEVLKDLYEAKNQMLPWSFWQPRDLRTLLDFYPVNRPSEKRDTHKAVEDALEQVKMLCKSIRLMEM